MRGMSVITISNFFNMISRSFLENSEYIAQVAPNKQKQVAFKSPDIVVNFFNTGDKLQVSIIDASFGIPNTTAKLPDRTASTKELQKAVLDGTTIPIIALGNANSFVKNIQLQQISDATIKAVLIDRASTNSLFSPRKSIFPSEREKATPANPLTLPLQGSATVLGHPGWMPFKAFYLFSGIFIMDAIYIITKVTHKLSAEKFDTEIEFYYH